MVSRVRSVVTLCVAALALSCASTEAQQEFGREFKMPPTWPANDRPPADLGGKYVYFDAAAKQMILAYPERLGEPNFAQNPGALKVHRFDLNTQVGASFSASVQRDTRPKSQQFIYTYAVDNARPAKYPIGSFDVVTSQFGGVDAVTAPIGWKAATAGSSINAIRASIGQPIGVFLSWYALSSDKFIAPGGRRSGISVSSALKPGLVVAYARGGQRPALSSEMPEEVLMQTVALMQMENNSQNVFTIGPKFGATASPEAIARDFDAGIKRLIEAKQLDRESQAVQEAQRVLAGVTTRAGAPAALRAPATRGLEAELIAAIKLSLNIQ